MKKDSTYVGLDAHKKMIVVAMLAPGRSEPVTWSIPNEAGAVRRMVRRVLREGSCEASFCYEAGPCGYALQRQIRGLGAECVVIAPSLIPVKPGERIKTDQRDAKKLAKLFQGGLLTEVRPPTPEEEAVRDLCRCREDIRIDLLRCRHRLSKMLLRRGLIWHGKSAWGGAHRVWLREVKFEHEADRQVFEDYLLGVEQMEARLVTLETRLEEHAGKAPYREPVGWLRCFRGIDTVTAMMIVAEIFDFHRFQSPRELMAYLGLVPSEHSSADSKRRGSITKAGNSHVRRVLIEAAWHQRHPFRIGKALRQRREGQPGRVIALADKAGLRLSRRFAKLHARGKPVAKTVVAVARELAGFVWAALYVPAAEPPLASLRPVGGAGAPLATARRAKRA